VTLDGIDGSDERERPVSDSEKRGDREAESPARRAWTFFRGFLEHPTEIGSVAASSRFLERRIVERTGVRQCRVVVELGPGTGGTTRALLDALPLDGILVALELSPGFASLLSRRFADPRLRIVNRRASQLRCVLEEHRLQSADAVVSGIPFSTMAADEARTTLEELHAALRPGGVFVAYQLSDRVARLGRALFGEPRVELEIFNLPPMRVFSWTKRGIPETGQACP